VPLLEANQIPVAPLKPANCGFDVNWSEYFRTRFAGTPVKSVRLSFYPSSGRPFHQRGEFVITQHGVEGSLIYSVSAQLRTEIENQGIAEIHLDLTPDWTESQLVEKLKRPRGSRSHAEHLRRMVGIRGVKAALLREFTPTDILPDPVRLSGALKDITIPLLAPRPLEEAISSAGGVPFEALNGNLMVLTLPGVFCAGEMLDWEAPTGGYLLTACIATGRAAGFGVLNHLDTKD
jgi:uncharacterized flavoprotein (TIGR03862 family)